MYGLFALAFGALAAGCAAEKGPSDDGSPLGPEQPAPSNCAGAFARTEAPYTTSPVFDRSGGFLVDERGLVFTAIADQTLTDAPAAYPPILIAGDLDGGLKTIYSSDTGKISNLVIDEENAYFSLLSGGFALVKVPRAGGEPTTLVEGGVRSAPMTDGKRLYYHAVTDGLRHAIYAIDKAGGTPTLITERGDKYLFASAMEGDLLYVLDSDNTETEADNSLYRISVTTGESELIATVPVESSGQLTVAHGVVYSTLFLAAGIETYRIEAGGATELVEGGMPLVFDGDHVYYASGMGGVTRNSLAFDRPEVVPLSAEKEIDSLAVGPTDLFFSELRCIYRTEK